MTRAGLTRLTVVVRRLVALLALASLIASCSAIDDIEGDLSTVTLPEVTIPDVTLPDVTLPDVTLPDVTLPDVTLPDLTIPDVTLPEVSTTVGEFTTTTTAPPEPVTTAEQVTTTSSSTTTSTTVVTTAPPTTTATTPVATTAPVAPTTTTAVAAPSTTLVEEEEDGISPWWLFVILALLGGVAYAVWRSRMEAARVAEWRERLRVAYLQGRWMDDQFDDRLIEERRSEPDPRGLRVALEPVLADIRRLEADATDAATRGALRELGDSMRGLDRAVDDAAGLTGMQAGEPSVPQAKARLAAATETVAQLSTGVVPPPPATG